MAPSWIKHPVKKGYNYMLVKLAHPAYVTKQYPQFWGAKLEVFVAGEKEESAPRTASFADFDATVVPDRGVCDFEIVWQGEAK